MLVIPPQTPAEPTGSWLGQWDEAFARLLERMGSDLFPTALRKLIELHVGFETMVVTRYQGQAQPESLYHDLDDVQAAISIQFYATGPYLLDPFAQACRADAVPGAHRLIDLVTEAFFRSEYYRTFYRKVRISDELGILIRHAPADWVVISLSRGARQPRFSSEDVARINAIHNTLSAAVIRHWQLDEAATQRDDDRHVEERLATFGADRLSPREAEVIRLILQGHTAGSASAFLGITEGTVKVHRHNAYGKLGVSSQAELFSVATRYLASKQP